MLARVIVNRLWQHHVGRGLVATPSDFGAQGAAPTHPELLDFLARRLIAEGWRLKPIHRLIVTSAAYRASSEFGVQDSESVATAPHSLDPRNETLWRFEPRRLEAEALRDSFLAVSGRLDGRMYGPGTLDENQLRRSVYFTVKRSKLIPAMQVFDVPEPNTGVGDRGSTTIAPQALHFLNGPQVRASAVALAARASRESPTDPLGRAYRLTLGREPSAAERDLAASYADTLAFAGRLRTRCSPPTSSPTCLERRKPGDGHPQASSQDAYDARLPHATQLAEARRPRTSAASRWRRCSARQAASANPAPLDPLAPKPPHFPGAKAKNGSSGCS